MNARRTARPAAGSLLAAAAAALLAVVAAAAADGPDARLPFNPVAGAQPGDWGLYRVTDPASPEERLTPELFTVESVKDGVVIVLSAGRESFKFPAGDAGASAVAYLRGFFGEARDGQLTDLRGITAKPERVEVGGASHDAWRIDGTLVSDLADDGKGKPGRVTRTVTVWVAPNVKGLGAVKAEATIDVAGSVHRGAISLESQGSAGEKPPPMQRSPQAATGTARPADAAAPSADRR